jgi:hypothetical protein
MPERDREQFVEALGTQDWLGDDSEGPVTVRESELEKRYHLIPQGEITARCARASLKIELLPRLINRKLVMSDGYPREVQFDPKSGYFVARYSEGEFWLLNKKLEPIVRAKRHLVRRCGFTYPRPIKPVSHR